LFTVPQSEYEKINGNPAISIIGYMAETGEGAHIITKGGSRHEITAQGWNPIR